MASRPNSPWLDESVGAYVTAHAAQPDDILRELAAETRERLGDRSIMQISADEGALLGLLVGLTRARLGVEVGTFTGYSALVIARAMGQGSRLVCCDISAEWTAIGRPYWERAGVADRIELHIGPAAETLPTLGLRDVDVAFIDADKQNYLTYYELLLPMLRRDGLILVDNTLWSGQVVKEPRPDDADTRALREFNDAIAADSRVDSYLLPVCDGLTLIRKR